MSRTDHVVCLDSKHEDSIPGHTTIRCEHCGERVDMRLPLSIRAFVACSNGFTEAHKDCEKEPKP